MRIIINASPERLTSITYYDGIGNQIYPPAWIENFKVTEYIKNISDENDIKEITIVGPQNYTKKIKEELQNIFKTVKFSLI